jgi:cell division protease FtsH
MRGGWGAAMGRVKYAGIVLLLLMMVALFNLFQEPESPQKIADRITYSAFIQEANKDNLATATFSGGNVYGTYKDGRSYSTYVGNVGETISILMRRPIWLNVLPPNEEVPSLLGVLVSWFPTLLYIFTLWLFIGRPLMRIEQRLNALERRPPPSRPDVLKTN